MEGVAVSDAHETHILTHFSDPAKHAELRQACWNCVNAGNTVIIGSRAPGGGTLYYRLINGELRTSWQPTFSVVMKARPKDFSLGAGSFVMGWLPRGEKK